MGITVFGIKSCNSMKKAFTKLDECDVAYEFHDYKKHGIDQTRVHEWVSELGIEKVLNKRGTTWRKQTDADKSKAEADIDYAIKLLVENTSMIKRPIVQGEYNNNQVLLCGFNDTEFDSTFNI